MAGKEKHAAEEESSAISTDSSEAHREEQLQQRATASEKRAERAESAVEADREEEAGRDESHPERLRAQRADSATPADRKTELSPDRISDSAILGQRIFRKSSPNNKLTLYLPSRDLVVSESKIDKLQGVLLVDPDYLQDKRVYGQITLTFRYGREDEEVMGLKFCNEAIMCLAQLYPPYLGPDRQELATTPQQEAIVKKLGSNAHAFTMEITPLAPPSVQLVPAKEYNGAPIGTSYEVRVYVAERADGKLQPKTSIRMIIRVIQRTSQPPLPATTMYSVPRSAAPSIRSRIQVCKTKVKFTEKDTLEDDENVAPHAAVEKPFLLSDGRVGLEAGLDRAVYAHGDSITVHVTVTNNSNKSVRRIKVFVVQHVDVCMFSNGKFKNVVALVSSREGCPVGPGSTLKKNYTLRPVRGSTKNWIALEDSYTKTGGNLASTVVCPGNGPEDRNVFAIYVSYYVKVKLLISAMGGAVSLKLPFTLMHSKTDTELFGYQSPVKEPSKPRDKLSEGHTANAENEQVHEEQDVVEKAETAKDKKKEGTVGDVDLIEECEEDAGT